MKSQGVPVIAVGDLPEWAQKLLLSAVRMIFGHVRLNTDQFKGAFGSFHKQGGPQ